MSRQPRAPEQSLYDNNNNNNNNYPPSPNPQTNYTQDLHYAQQPSPAPYTDYQSGGGRYAPNTYAPSPDPNQYYDTNGRRRSSFSASSRRPSAYDDRITRRDSRSRRYADEDSYDDDSDSEDDSRHHSHSHRHSSKKRSRSHGGGGGNSNSRFRQDRDRNADRDLTPQQQMEREFRTRGDKAKEKAREHLSTSDRGVGAGLLGAVAGGILAQEATKNKEVGGGGRIGATIAGLILGGLGGNVLEKKIGERRERERD